MRAIARRRKLLVAGLPGAFGNAASVRARRREPGSTFVRSSKPRIRRICPVAERCQWRRVVFFP
ncbi:hypothetical protein OQI_28350 [Streptomyces pharetrae CZA14]|uniref:Uncharacterized protein n=1 Tax=Streptomyces pharetrae CZA14 TaxID=1144883 RepID=A0ABX3YBJ5_9ACTN|nr:hypothetical protein OQI_28350 [Streptomyces pharetrae CZA14]